MTRFRRRRAELHMAIVTEHLGAEERDIGGIRAGRKWILWWGPTFLSRLEPLCFMTWRGRDGMGRAVRRSGSVIDYVLWWSQEGDECSHKWEPCAGSKGALIGPGPARKQQPALSPQSGAGI